MVEVGFGRVGWSEVCGVCHAVKIYELMLIVYIMIFVHSVVLMVIL